MNVNDIIHNFKVASVTPIKELDATVYEYIHEKCGARVVWIDRKDENKVFTVGFKTHPEDSTGVPHILEHSVLSGSQKYPVKELFIELIKGTYNTYLDAGTGQDLTRYLAGTRNNEEYLNLVDYEMSCVLTPYIYNEPRIFYQEGWHHELLNKEDDLIYKGVVFNEVKGSQSNPMSVLFSNVKKKLFPDTIYVHNSGGDPACVPDLTYEQFCAFHKKYYHPTNCCVAMDGAIDIDAVLTLLDEEYFSKYENSGINVQLNEQGPITYTEYTEEYEIGQNESEENKTYFAYGYTIGKYTEKEKYFAMNVIADVLTGSDNAPLNKAITAAGLGQSAKMMVSNGLQPYVTLLVSNTDKSKIDAVKATIRETIETVVREGLDKTALESAFNSFDFGQRRRRTEGPVGLFNCGDIYSAWNYRGSIEDALAYEDALESLRAKLNTRYFEEILEACILNNDQSIALTVLPSKTIGQQIAQREVDRLKAEKAAMSDEELDALIARTKDLIEWQSTPNSEETMSLLKVLPLEAIDVKPEENPVIVGETDGVPTVCHPLDTKGISHTSLYFDASDLTLEELPYASLLASLMGKLGTAKYDAAKVATMLKVNTGRFDVSPEFYMPVGRADACKSYIAANVSVLGNKAAEGMDLLREVLTASNFDDAETVRYALVMAVAAYRQKLNGRGYRCAVTVRSRAYSSAEGVALEYTEGYEYFTWVNAQLKNFDAVSAELIEKLKALAAKLFTRNRLTISVSGNEVNAEVKALAAALPAGEAPAAAVAEYKPLGARQEGMLIPAAVSCSSQFGNLYNYGAEYNGKYEVLAKLISTSYLWQEIRMKGGAYGGGLDIFANGDILYNAFRDPTAHRSLGIFDAAEQFVRDYCASDEDIRKIIASTVSGTEPLAGPIGKMKSADEDYFRGFTFEDHCRVRAEMLSTTKEDLLELCKTLQDVREERSISVVGGQKHLDACGDKLATILTI